MKYLAAMVLIVGFICYSRGSAAFNLEPHPMACMLYFQSDAVFTGQVIATRQNSQPNSGVLGIEGWYYTLEIIKAYRGVHTPTVQVYTGNDSGRLPLDVGKKYLLFADKQNGQLVISDDEISGELKHAQHALKVLNKIMTRKPGMGGDIYGRVVQGPFNDTEGGLRGVLVTVKGPAGGARAISGSNGWFHMHVPSGRYSAKASDGKLVFVSQDIAWQNSDNFTVPDGGCAEIQFYTGPSSSTSQ